jgi:hypothetical protein
VYSYTRKLKWFRYILVSWNNEEVCKRKKKESEQETETEFLYISTNPVQL